MRRLSFALVMLTLGALRGASPLLAQADRVTIQVTDVQGNAIPFAFVQIVKGVSRVADDSGRAVFTMRKVDSLNLQVRRIGFDPFTGWATRRNASGAFLVDLMPLPRALDPVTIAGRRDTPLARTGFYDRVERIQRGAYAARMITPEEMDLRNPIRLSQVLAGESIVKVTPMGGKQVLMGRGIACAMTVLLDGQRLSGTYEEAVGNPNPPPLSSLTSIDELINAQQVAAIEVYGSAAAVPVELQRMAGSRMSQGCGLVAIWTGSRR